MSGISVCISFLNWTAKEDDGGPEDPSLGNRRDGTGTITPPSRCQFVARQIRGRLSIP